jgi:hypothetical protein
MKERDYTILHMFFKLKLEFHNEIDILVMTIALIMLPRNDFRVFIGYRHNIAASYRIFSEDFH